MTPPHTRSIFWPLALVAAGTLWLLANARVIPASNFWVLLQRALLRLLIEKRIISEDELIKKAKEIA